jgi:hypothetical protein
VKQKLKQTTALLVVSLGAALAAGGAQASPFFGTLEFLNRTGTVYGDESIPVELRLTLDADSAPLGLDGEGSFTDVDTRAAAIAGLESRGYADPILTGAWISTAFACAGATFGGPCVSPATPYAWAWGWAIGANGLGLSLAPGESAVLTQGTFSPNPSPAPAGLYTYTNALLFLLVSGDYANPLHDPNNPDHQEPGDPNYQPPRLPLPMFGEWLDIASTNCGGWAGDPPVPDCRFERTVIDRPGGGGGGQVPLPGTLALLGLGLAALAGSKRMCARSAGRFAAASTPAAC